MDIDKDLLTLLVQDYASLTKAKQQAIIIMAIEKEYYELLAVLKQYLPDAEK